MILCMLIVTIYLKKCFRQGLEGLSFKIAINPKYDGYQRKLASMVHKFFEKEIGSGATRNERENWNEELAQELYKPKIKRNLKDGKSVPGIKIISEKQIWLKRNYLRRI